MRVYIAIIISLGIVNGPAAGEDPKVSFIDYYDKSCGSDIPSYLNTQCNKYDPNLECNDSNAGNCRCRFPFVRKVHELYCYDTRKDVQDVIYNPKPLTGEIVRHAHCEFTVILGARRVFDISGGRPHYVWYCALDKTELPDLYNRDRYDRSNRGCFGGGILLRDQTDYLPFYFIKSEHLPCKHRTYYFRMYFWNNKLYTVHDLTAHLHDKFRPHVQITCKTNCQYYATPSAKMILLAECSNCDYEHSKDIIFEWGTFEPGLNLSDLRIPGGSQDVLVIAENKLIPRKNYTFIVTGIWPSGKQAWTHRHVVVGHGLTVGTCTVAPPQGYVMRTLYTVKCENFADPNKNPLQYALRERGHGDHLLYTSETPIISGLRLPLGHVEDGWKLPLTVTICSISKDPLCTTVPLNNVTVEPSQDLDVEQLSEDLGEEQDALQTSLTLSTLLNIQLKFEQGIDPETKQEFRRKRRRARERILGAMKNVTVNSIGVVHQQTSVLYEVTKEREEISDESLVNGAVLLQDLVSNFAHYIADTQTGETEETGKSMINVMSSLMAVAQNRKDTSDELDQPVNIDQRELRQGLLSSLNFVLEALARNKIAGETPTTVETKELTVRVDVRSPLSIQHMKVELKSETENNTTHIQFPSNFPVPDLKHDIAIEAIHFKENPYVWSDNAKEVTSPVMQVTLKRIENDRTERTIQTNNLTSPVRILIPQKPVAIQATNITMASNDEAFVFFNKTSLGSKVLVHVDNAEGDLPPDVVIKVRIFCVAEEETVENLEDFTSSKTASPIFNGTVLLGNGDAWLEPATTMGSHFVDLELMASPSLTTGTNYTFHMFVSEIKCQYWDEETEAWSDEGCYAGEESTNTQLVCYCTHMTSFAGGFLLMPNQLNFKEDVAGFLRPWENPVGIAAVCCVLFIYLIALYFARRKDRVDFLRGAVINLADNNPRYRYTYIVTVQTGSRKNAGSTANCCCVLIGSRGQSEPHILFSSSTPMCQSGSIDSFVVRTRYSLGPITRIKFWHDNTGDSPEWFLSTCQVVDVQEGELYIFICNYWLSDCLGDKTIVKTFKIATEAEKKNWEHLFFTNTTEAIQDMHMWFSPYTHQPSSPFTTVQRVSCCLSLFMTLMCTNIMFYGTEPEAGGEMSMDLGPTSITWTELRIGITSAVIMLPANTFLITIFTYVRRRYASNLYQVNPRTLHIHLALSAIKDDNMADIRTLAELDSCIMDSTLKFLYASPTELSKVSVPVFPHVQKSESLGSGVKVREELSRQAKKQKKGCQCKCYLPWWFVYVNWVILFSIVFVSGFFIILYSFNYGLEISMKWLSTILVTSMSDAFVTQPLKLVAFAFAFSMIFRSTLSEPGEVQVNTEPSSYKDFLKTKVSDNTPYNLSVYIPPEQIPSRPDADIIRIQNDEKVHGLFFEIVRYMIFLYLAILITYGRQDKNLFFLNAYISEQVIAEEDMHGCGDLESIWEYISDTLMDGLYDPEQEEYVHGIASLRLSPPILIQTRSPRCEASSSPVLKKMGITKIRKCAGETDKKAYGPEWDASTVSIAKMWHFNTTFQGYVAELTQSQKQSKLQLDYLAGSLWLDRYTTSLTIRVILYNPILNLMTHLEVTFAINNPVGVQAEKKLTSFKMYRSTRQMDIFLVILETAYVAYSLYFMFFVSKCIYQQRSKYFKSVWSYLDFMVVLVSLNVIAVYICHAYFADQAVLKFQETGEVNQFDTVLLLHHYVTYILALLVTLALIKFINMLRFNPTIFRFLEVLQRAKVPLLWSTFLMAVIHLQFAGMFHVIAAGRIEMFRSIRSSMEELFVSLMGEYEVQYLEIIHPVLGPLAFLGFLITAVYIALNMMSAILILTVWTVRREKLPDDESRLLALLIDRILQWLGIARRKEGRIKRGKLKRRRVDSEQIIMETTYV